LYIRLPVKFDNEANESITDEIQGKEKPIKRTFFPDAPEDNEKDDPLKKGLVKLRRMAEVMAEVQGEIHTPRHVGDPSVKLTINEVTNSSKGISEWDGGAEEIGKTPEVYLMFAAKHKGR